MWQENRNSGLVLSQGLVSKGRDDVFYHRGMWSFEKENDGLPGFSCAQSTIQQQCEKSYFAWSLPAQTNSDPSRLSRLPYNFPGEVVTSPLFL